MTVWNSNWYQPRTHNYYGARNFYSLMLPMLVPSQCRFTEVSFLVTLSFNWYERVLFLIWTCYISKDIKIYLRESTPSFVNRKLQPLALQSPDVPVSSKCQLPRQPTKRLTRKARWFEIKCSKKYRRKPWGISQWYETMSLWQPIRIKNCRILRQLHTHNTFSQPSSGSCVVALLEAFSVCVNAE